MYARGMPDGNPPPLTPAGFQVALALASGHAHGYGIMAFIAEVTDGAAQLGPGTLYRTLSRLAADGLVEETTDITDGAPHDARRRNYRLTGLGRRAAEREARQLSALLDAASAAGLADTGRAESA
ncbi:helix-turn-helix transcriptional regulator [Amycolatopsis minnesotensis]|uniref:Helix-turn-helix transcriptional regulator n=2 Tax=Amycolatopsis minnesotensis TaxID=337894 RepID=A0ABN2R219_9PSEU